MSNDDDLIRRALRPSAPPRVASVALRDLQPIFKRRRRQRRALLGATGALMLSGSAAVYAAATQPSPESLRLSGSPSMSLTPEPETTATTAAPSTTLELIEIPATSIDATDPPGAEAPATSAPGLPVDPPPTAAPRIRPAPESTTTPATIAPATPAPPTTAPSTTVAASTTQPLTSDCGTVNVVVDGSTVRIVSITPNPGYTATTGDDGPKSIEVKFEGPDGKCEVHAELKSSGLDVEIQGSHD